MTAPQACRLQAALGASTAGVSRDENRSVLLWLSSAADSSRPSATDRTSDVTPEGELELDPELNGHLVTSRICARARVDRCIHQPNQ